MFQDIRPKRSLKEILPNKHKSEQRLVAKKTESIKSTVHNVGRPPVLKWISILVSLAAVVALFFFGSGFFVAATVEVIPKQKPLVLAETFEAVKAPGDSSATLTFDVLTTDWKKVSQVTTGVAKEKISRSASGQIIIYNDYSKTPFDLVANTRFEAPNGKIFRIREKVVIPGQKSEGDKVVPGSTEATVYAAEPGDKYNLGLVDFVVPGLRGSPAFGKVYARSKTPLTGGFVGEVNTIPKNEEERIRTKLREDLRQKLIGNVRFQIPPTFIFYAGAAAVNFRTSQPSSTSSSPTQGNSVLIEESGQLQSVIFNRQQLTKLLLKKGIPGFAGQPVEIQGLDQLNLTLLTKIVGPLADVKKVSFRLEGSVQVVGVIKVEELQTKLAGLKRTEIKTALQQFPLIESATVTLQPSWWTKLPSDPAKIRVKVVIPN